MDSIISENRIFLDIDIESKKELIEKLATSFYEENIIEDIDMFLKDIYKREEEFSTHVGNYIAIPHAISKVVKQPAIAFLRASNPFQFGNDEEVQLAFMLAIPEDSNKEHLGMLSSLATKLMHKDFQEQLMNTQSKTEIIKLLDF